MLIKIGRHGRSLNRRPGGMTLVELAAVLAILSILIAIALPRYLGMHKRAYKDEADHILQEVKTLEWGYYAENSAFTGSLSSIGFVMPGNSHWSTPAFSLSGGQGCQGNQSGNGAAMKMATAAVACLAS